MKLLCRIFLRHGRVTVFLSLVLAGVGAYYSALLYMKLKPDIEELLPTTARSVIDLKSVTTRLAGIDSLNLIILSKDTRASRNFVNDLAVRLKALPKDLVASVEYRITEELAFFKKRQALFVDTNDLSEIRDYIANRIAFEKELYNPLNIFRETEIHEPKYDFDALIKKHIGQASFFSRFPEGYFVSRDGHMRIMLIYLAGKAADLPNTLKLKRLVKESVDRLDPKRYAADLEVHYSGTAQDLIEEQAALLADLELSTILVLILCAIAMVLYYKHVGGTIALLISLFVGTLWTFGVAYFLVGYLNANSAFLGSIVIGNGINFGIIYLARYLEERRKGRDQIRANMLSMQGTATSTATAALAAGLSYGSLMLTDFRGFKQFGVIGLIGMILCWISAYVLMPPLLKFFDRKPRGSLKPHRVFFANWVALFVEKFHRPIWIATLGATVLAIAVLVFADKDILENDLSRLRDKTSLEEGSGYYGKMVDTTFDRVMAPAVLLPQDRKGALEIAKILRQEVASDPLAKRLIVGIRTIDDFVPADQERKIVILNQIRKLLNPKLLKHLGPDDRKLATAFLTAEVNQTMGLDALPEMVKSKFREKTGAIGNLVVIDPPLEAMHWSGEDLISFVRILRAAGDKVEPGTAVAGPFPITADMYEVIKRDGPKATLIAFLAVIVLIVGLFRNVRIIFLCLFSLVMGVGWLAALVLAFKLKINFLNFIAFPITFGIGVDYGVNIFQRYRLEGSKNILEVLRQTGGAVALASLTTIIGYGSLLIAGNQAFVSFGRLAVVGELTCLVAALISFPAFLYIRDKSRAART